MNKHTFGWLMRLMMLTSRRNFSRSRADRLWRLGILMATTHSWQRPRYTEPNLPSPILSVCGLNRMCAGSISDGPEYAMETAR